MTTKIWQLLPYYLHRNIPFSKMPTPTSAVLAQLLRKANIDIAKRKQHTLPRNSARNINYPRRTTVGRQQVS